MTKTYYKNLLLTLLTLLLLSQTTTVRAQKLQASLSHYSTENGLPSNSISKLRCDDYGFIWIATWNGIARFDGYDFYNYKTGIASGIPGMHNRVDDMVIDPAQNVWLKMYDGRIFVINRKTDCIVNPLEGISGADELRTSYFFTPYVTTVGDVLISFDDGSFYKFRLDRNGLQQQLITTGSLQVNCVVEGYHNDLWVGTNHGVHRINMPNLSLENDGYFPDEHITRLTTNGYNIFASTKSGKIMQFAYGQEPSLMKDVGREITGLFVDSHGTVWFSDLGDGAYRYNPSTHDVKFFKHRLLVPEFTSRGAEFGEAMGTVWIRMNHGGYGYYNRDADEIEYFHNDPSNPWNLSNTVNASLELNEGVVWESTNRRGLEKLEIQKNNITRTLLVPEAESPLANETRAIYYDKKRELLLVGNKRGALFITDKHGNRHTITHDSNGNPFSRLYGISADSKGNYWLSDKDNGVYKMEPTGSGNYTITNFCHRDGDKSSLSANSAYQTVEDKNGHIWVATYGGGVNVIAKDKDGHYTVYNSQNLLKKYPRRTHQRVRTIALDQEGKVWAGTTDGIVIMSLNGHQFSCSMLESPTHPEQGLASNDIVCLARDRSGNMWVGTNSGGLSHTTEKDDNGMWKFETYGQESGLPSEEILSLTFDNKGNVWFATDHILCSLDTKKKIVTTFSSLDGVDDTMCSEGAAVALPNGIVLFGTIHGYYTVDREKLTTKTGSLLKLRITDFFLNDELQSPRLNQNFDYYVPESKSVTLPHHDDSFAFRFAAMNNQFQHRIHYQYRLEGYEDQWRNADKNRMAVYSDLPAGTYHFQVKAFLLESPEYYDMRTIEVIVPPSPLLSATAIIVYLLLLTIAILGWLWWRKSHSRKTPPSHQTAQKATHEEQSTEKSKEMTDEYEIIED